MKDSIHQQSEGIFATMARLPLLRGASLSRLSEIVGRMKVHFFKASPGEIIVNGGDPCGSLLFVLSGSVRLLSAHNSGSPFAVEQTLEAPQVIAPEYLFGLTTSFPAQVTALDHVGLMEISKEDYRRMLALDPVFLFNYLNTACARAQRSQSGLLSIASGSAIERIAYWVTALSQPGATDITLRSEGRELHQTLGLSAAALRSAAEKLSPMVALVDPHTLHAPARTPLRDLLG